MNNKMPLDVVMQYEGKFYSQVETSDFKEGDFVFDTLDNTVGVVDLMMKNNQMAIRDGHVVEINIPIERVRKLVEVTKGNV